MTLPIKAVSIFTERLSQGVAQFIGTQLSELLEWIGREVSNQVLPTNKECEDEK